MGGEGELYVLRMHSFCGFQNSSSVCTTSGLRSISPQTGAIISKTALYSLFNARNYRHVVPLIVAIAGHVPLALLLLLLKVGSSALRFRPWNPLVTTATKSRALSAFHALMRLK